MAGTRKPKTKPLLRKVARVLPKAVLAKLLKLKIWREEATKNRKRKREQKQTEKRIWRDLRDTGEKVE